MIFLSEWRARRPDAHEAAHPARSSTNGFRLRSPPAPTRSRVQARWLPSACTAAARECAVAGGRARGAATGAPSPINTPSAVHHPDRLLLLLPPLPHCSTFADEFSVGFNGASPMLNSNGSQWVQHVFIALFVFAGEHAHTRPRCQCWRCQLPCQHTASMTSDTSPLACRSVCLFYVVAGLGYTFITNIQHSWQTLGYSLALGATAVQWVRSCTRHDNTRCLSARAFGRDAVPITPVLHHHSCALRRCSPSSSSASGTSAS